jgi:hypothetical protein
LSRAASASSSSSAAPSAATVHDGRVHAGAYLVRAVDCFEKALILLDSTQANNTTTDGMDALETAGATLAIARRPDVIASTTAALADALAAQNKLAAALSTAIRALALRRENAAANATSASAAVSLVHSLQQVAALYERNEKPSEALRHLEQVIAALHQYFTKVEAAIPVMHRTMRHIIRLVFRRITSDQRQQLHKLMTLHAEDLGREEATLTFVVGKLLDGPSPASYVHALLTQAITAVATRDVHTLYDAVDSTAATLEGRVAVPPLAGQVAALGVLLSAGKDDHSSSEHVSLDMQLTASNSGSSSSSSAAAKSPSAKISINSSAHLMQSS